MSEVLNVQPAQPTFDLNASAAAVEKALDAVLETCRTRFAAAYGVGFGALPWQAIIAAILSVLSGCALPTAANIRAQFARPLVKIKVLRKLVEVHGVTSTVASKSLTAFGVVLDKSEDADIDTLVKASIETA